MCGEQAVVVVVDESFVFLVVEKTYNGGVLLGVFLADSLGVIGRGIVSDDNLELLVTLLTEDAVECAPDGFFLVICANDD